MQRLAISQHDAAGAARGLRPTKAAQEDVRRAVADIVAAVRESGDEAVRRLTARLDGADLRQSRVAPAERTAALEAIDPRVREALELLATNLRIVVTELVPPPTRVELPQGQIVSTRQVPVQRAGLYVPGGNAAYPSSAVMAVVPAQVAGVPEICVCSPPDTNGRVQPSVLAACALLGVDEVYAIGGAQAIAAMAVGTETVRSVDLVVGPGNAYVEEAKRLLFGEVGIESLAGPSELIVLSDGSGEPEPLAWDLMAQAEHGAGAQSVLVSTRDEMLDAVAKHLGEGDVTLILADSWDAAVAFANSYAPEHLQLAVEDPEAVLDQILHAGAVFMGHSSATAFGDYVAGSNHILPTAGNARYASGLGPAVYLRSQEVVEVPPGAVAKLAGPLEALALAEGLPAHARSATIRAEQVQNPT
jgi:histidinol dehydrogenase